MWEPISLGYLWRITVTVTNTTAHSELIIALLSLLEQSAKKKREREKAISFRQRNTKPTDTYLESNSTYSITSLI